MTKLIIIILIFLLLIPLSLACMSPIVYNEYGVPISLYGGFLIINGTKYNTTDKIIPYNLTVNNTNNQPLTLTISPTSDLFNYVYQSTITVNASQKANMSLQVYVDGPNKAGTLFVTGQCLNGYGIPEGSITALIYGRGNETPQTCSNTVLSCGIYPDCQDLTELSGCYEGYYRSYACAGNTPVYSSSCTDYCCKDYYGPEGSCQSEGGQRICKGPPQYCNDECRFTGAKCINGDVYTCELQWDGCYDLIQQEECGLLSCYDGECVNESAKDGKIAFLCRDDNCNEEIEPELISWLKSKNYIVSRKAYNSWSDTELDNYDLIICSDESRACKTDKSSIPYKEHKYQNRSFIEIADDRYLEAAYRFEYISNQYGTLASSDSIYTTRKTDPIVLGFPTTTQVFFSSSKMSITYDYRLNSNVIDIADVGADNGKSTLFKVDSQGTQGRYAYVGWFYNSHISSLTPDGEKLLSNVIKWGICGDACLTDPNANLPPVAEAGPNQTVNLGSIVQFDGSASYDPNGDSLEYYWDFGDGITGTGEKPTHVYNQVGEYTVTLIVNDGTYNSTPDTLTVFVLPVIKNKVAFICGDNSCSDPSEQELTAWLTENGYYVIGKSLTSWTEEELSDYDFMICSSAGSGCSIKSWSAPYKKHVYGRMGFIEIPNYQYIRAGYSFKYVSWYSSYKSNAINIKIIREDPITQGFSELIPVFYSNKDVAGISNSRLKPQSISLAELTDKDASTLLKVDASGTRGRYAYVGWFYRANSDNLTNEGNILLLRTIRWVQCGKVDGC